MAETKVTDPDLIARLNKATQGGEKVTDPELIRRLEAASGGKSEPAESTLSDVGKSLVSGVGKGTVSLPGVPGSLVELGRKAADWATGGAAPPETGGDLITRKGRELVAALGLRPASGSFTKTPLTAPEAIEKFNNLVAPRGVTSLVTGEKPSIFHEPKTTAGHYAETVGEFLPAAVAGPGGIGRKLATSVGGGLASEGAGQATAGTPLEPWARLAGGVAGGVAGGAAASGTAQAARNVFAPGLAPELRGIDRTALDWAAKLARADGLTDAEIAAKFQRLGPEGFLAEYGPNLKQGASFIAARPGTGKAVINQEIEARAAASRQRVEDAVTNVAGPRYNMANILKNSIESRAAISDPLYEAYRNIDVHPTPELQEISKQLNAAGVLKAGLKKAAMQGQEATKRFFMIGKGLPGFPAKTSLTAEGWDYTKRALDEKIEEAIKFSRGDDARILTGLKNRLTNAIDNHPNPAVQGVWKQARDAYAHESAIMDARAEGQRVFDPRVRSDDLGPKYAGYSQPEKTAFMEGARDNIAMLMDHSVKGASDELKAGAFNRLIDPEGARKLATLYGPQGAKDLTDAFKREWEFNATHSDVLKNSQTAARQAVGEMMTPDPGNTLIARLRGAAPHLRPGSLIPATLEEASTVRQAQQFERARNELAPLLMRKGADAERLAKALQGYQPRQSLGQFLGREIAPGRASRALARTLVQTLPHMQ